MNQDTIWIIEDNPASQLLLNEIVMHMNITPVCFNSAENLLDTIEQLDVPKLIFMDIGLPGLDGIKTLHLVQNTYHITAPIIAITAHVMKTEINTYQKRGFTKVLQKPITIKQIQRIIHTTLKKERIKQ